MAPPLSVRVAALLIGGSARQRVEVLRLQWAPLSTPFWQALDLSYVRFDRAVTRLAGLAALLASFAIVAHLARFALDALPAIGVADMPPVTAVALLFAAASLWASRFGANDTAIALMRAALAALPLTVAAGTLAEIALGRSLFMDLGLGGGRRMSPHTALALLPLGLALALSPRRQRVATIVTAACLGAVALAAAALLGMAYNRSLGYRVGDYVGMSLFSAIAILALSLGRLLRDDRPGLVEFLTQPYAGSRFVRQLLPLMLVVPLLFGLLRALAEDGHWFDTDVGVALMAVATAATLGALLVRSGRLLNEAERSRDTVRAAQERERAWWQAALASVGAAVIVVDRELRVGAIDGNARRLLGAGAVEGRALVEVLRLEPDDTSADRWPSGPAAADAVLAAAIGGDERAAGPWRMASGDEWRVVELAASSLQPIDDGGDASAVIVLRDVTAQRAAERALREANERLEMRVGERTAQLAKANVALRTLVDATPGIVYMKDESGRLLLVNPAFEATLGIPAAAVLGKRIDEYAPNPVIAERTNRVEREVMESRSAHTSEEVVPTVNGPRRFAVTRVPWLDERGACRGVIGFAYDVTDQLAMAAALEEREARYKALVASLPDVIFRLDRQLRFIFVSDAIRRFSRIDAADWIGRGVDEMAVRADATTPAAEGFVAAARRALATGKPVVHELDLRERVLRTRLIPELGAEGRPVTLLGISQDITAQVSAERERARLLQAERSARERAEAASRSQDEMLAVVSHELRTPLSAMIGWLRVLQREADAGRPNVQRALEAIERNVDTQRRLVEDLLDTARMIRGQLRVSLEPVSLGALVAAVVDAVRPQADAQGVALNLTIEPGDLQVMGDATRLEQIVSNLLSNALKFTPRGGHVAVSIGREPEGIAIAVQDTGIGIEPSALPQVFDRFWQADRSMTRRFGGLGLGLTVARYLAELHGGRIEADSAGQGQGALFTVHLPRAA